jgi:hypothetical protein
MRKLQRVKSIQPGRTGKKSICGYFHPDVSRRLRLLAVQHDKNVQTLLGEALTLLFLKYGQKKIA